MNNLKIVLSGGSGFIGQSLASRWCEHNEVVIFSREGRESNNAGKTRGLPANVRTVYWDGSTWGDWISELENCDLLVNLAGKSVNCRYTDANKAAIINSRVDSTTILGQAIANCKTPPRLWINCCSATIYPLLLRTLSMK